jgi:hypothetical protein
MRVLFVAVLSIIASAVYTQETSPYTKFGKITVEELQKKIYPIDSNANAVVLSDIGDAAIEGNSKNWFSISFTHHRVVHILNKNGYEEADVKIPLYNIGEREEKLDNIKAVTYNLENGKIVETKLDKSSIFKEKRDNNWSVKKFTFPNVKEGCIIEYDYEVTSDFIQNLDPWIFQGESPVLWSEYRLSVPEFFRYAFLSHGYQPLYINERKDRQANFTVMETRGAGATERASFTAGVTDYRWAMKNVPKLKEESFTSSIKNHIARLEFQLSSQGYPLAPHDYRNTWTGLSKELLSSPYFGSALDKSNNWLADEVKPLVKESASETEKARKIFSFVRDNFSCTDYAAMYTDQSLKNVMKAKKGNVAEINLLITAMMRYAGLQADPVILSTTNHGYALEMYPMSSSFNYVVCTCWADGKNYYLDASRPRLGFGKLPPQCYNGHARIVNEEANPVYLLPDSLIEKKITGFFITNDDKGNWIGNLNQNLGYYESYEIRDRIKEKGEETFFKEIQKEYGEDLTIKAPHIDSLNNYEEPIALKYEVDLHPAKDDILYINPMFAQGLKKNPFTSTERYYPVEMPYTMDKTYVLTMEVPQGYVVDELPKQLVAKLDEEGSAYFEYRLSQSGSIISLRSRLKISRTLFANEEYENLREFFNLIVNKQNEQIVFKKKK